MSVPPTASENVHRAELARWFAEEAQAHEPALRAWLRREYPMLSDVDDIVQESYLRLLRARAAGHIVSGRAYLFGIARYVALGIFRKRRIFSETPVNELTDSDTIPAEESTVETVDFSQRLELAADAIKTLPARCREVVVLRSLRGLSYPEIAAQLGLAEGTVRVQMARGIKKCAQWMRERGMMEARER